jgi:hypothetical protein
LIIYTAIFGDYDIPVPAFKSSLIEASILFTDNIKIHAPGWHVIHSPKISDNPIHNARYWKLHPPSGCSIWLDGQISLTNEILIVNSMKALEKYDIVLWRHPWRHCLYQEAQECYNLGYGQNVLDQANHYKNHYNFPENYGLWETGVLARRTTDNLLQMHELWWKHIRDYSYRDQVSFPLMLNLYNIVPFDLPDLMRDGKRVSLNMHSKERSTN